MHEVTRTANVVGQEALAEAFAVPFPRRELETLRDVGEPAQLWLELEREGNGGPKRLTIDLTTSDIEELLQHPNGDDLLIALDGYALNGLFDDGEVEAHGLRSALAIAVVAAGMAAPAGLAAVPQVSSATASPAASAHAASPAAKGQVARGQIARTAAKGQVARTAAKGQIARTQIARTAAVGQAVPAGLRYLAAGVTSLTRSS